MAPTGNHMLGYLKDRPVFFGMIYTFNLCPSGYAHPSHWPATLKREALEGALSFSPAAKRLSEWLLEKEGIQGTFVEDFDEAPRRLALLEADVVQRLFLFAGAALLHERIAQVVSREDKQALESQLGSEIYTFVVRRASLMVGQRPQLQGLSEQSGELFNDILGASQRCFEACFAGAEKALKARFQLKLPASLEWKWDSAHSSEISTQAWTFLKRLLAREVSPDSLSCFD